MLLLLLLQWYFTKGSWLRKKSALAELMAGMVRGRAKCDNDERRDEKNKYGTTYSR